MIRWIQSLLIYSIVFFVLATQNVYAKDLLSGMLTGDIKDTFGSSAVFWSLLALVNVVISSVAYIMTGQPKVFFSVFIIVMVVPFLLNNFVFS